MFDGKPNLESYSEGDETRFLSNAMQMATHESRQGHAKLGKHQGGVTAAGTLRRKNAAAAR
jgi:hypothetical protein